MAETWWMTPWWTDDADESTQQQPTQQQPSQSVRQRTRGMFSWKEYAFNSEEDDKNNVGFLIVSSCSSKHNSDTLKVADLLQRNGLTYVRMKPTKDKQTIMKHVKRCKRVIVFLNLFFEDYVNDVFNICTENLGMVETILPFKNNILDVAIFSSGIVMNVLKRK
ncbi:uncharacterized protein [Antedon mediterranea]|uniref:uncharacterized protein n=1 Tax=Antedon mediterranea TaxID=105859 RepID=UPI003AF994D8